MPTETSWSFIAERGSVGVGQGNLRQIDIAKLMLTVEQISER